MLSFMQQLNARAVRVSVSHTSMRLYRERRKEGKSRSGLLVAKLEVCIGMIGGRECLRAYRIAGMLLDSLVVTVIR